MLLKQQRRLPQRPTVAAPADEKHNPDYSSRMTPEAQASLAKHYRVPTQNRAEQSNAARAPAPLGTNGFVRGARGVPIPVRGAQRAPMAHTSQLAHEEAMREKAIEAAEAREMQSQRQQDANRSAQHQAEMLSNRMKALIMTPPEAADPNALNRDIASSIRNRQSGGVGVGSFMSSGYGYMD